jgi:hypothetical protein
MSRSLTVLLLLALYVLHQDVWFWHTAHPVVFGVFPIGLFYHVSYTLVTSLALWLLVRTWMPAADSFRDDR